VTISFGGITVVIGRGGWLCLDCRRVKEGRTIWAERCFGCAHRFKEIRSKKG